MTTKNPPLVREQLGLQNGLGLPAVKTFKLKPAPFKNTSALYVLFSCYYFSKESGPVIKMDGIDVQRPYEINGIPGFLHLLEDGRMLKRARETMIVTMDKDTPKLVLQHRNGRDWIPNAFKSHSTVGNYEWKYERSKPIYRWADHPIRQWNGWAIGLGPNCMAWPSRKDDVLFAFEQDLGATKRVFMKLEDEAYPQFELPKFLTGILQTEGQPEVHVDYPGDDYNDGYRIAPEYPVYCGEPLDRVIGQNRTLELAPHVPGPEGKLYLWVPDAVMKVDDIGLEQFVARKLHNHWHEDLEKRLRIAEARKQIEAAAVEAPAEPKAEAEEIEPAVEAAPVEA
jgi:hypothetical protein